MQNELDIVRDVSRRLEQGGLAYMLTGSMAMNYYAQPRMTRDIDVVVALAPPDTDTVVRLLLRLPRGRRQFHCARIAFQPHPPGERHQSRLHRPQEHALSPRRV
jgi:hypothetical protein